MDSISFYAHPEILSTISFHIDNYKDASIHISINCVRTKKFIRVVIGNKFCLMNDKKLTPEALKERKYISSAGTSGYPDAWDKFMQIWDTFTRLEALIALCRSRWTMDGTLTPLP